MFSELFAYLRIFFGNKAGKDIHAGKNKYGTKSVKIAKVPQNERLSFSCSKLFRVVLAVLLSHAEVFKDIS